MPQRLAAVDTEVLLLIQSGAPAYVEAHRLLQDEGFLFVAVPTVVRELEKISERVESFWGPVAQNILDRPRDLGLLLRSLQDFTDVQLTVADIHVHRVIERGIIGEQHRGDLSAMIEAAYLDCLLFVTDSQAVIGNRQALTAAFIQDCGMRAMYLAEADEIVRLFGVENPS